MPTPNNGAWRGPLGVASRSLQGEQEGEGGAQPLYTLHRDLAPMGAQISRTIYRPMPVPPGLVV